MTEVLNSSQFRKRHDGESISFLGHVSFEERSLSVARSISPANVKHSMALVTEGRMGRTEANLEEFMRTLPGTDLRYVSTEPMPNSKGIRGAVDDLAKIASGKVAILDVTAFRREELLVLLQATLDLDEAITRQWRAVYVSADTMGETLSSDVVDCRSVVGFAGAVRPSRPNRLVVLVGFEKDRAQAIIDAYEPDVLVLAFGDKEESISSDFAVKNRKLFREFETLYGASGHFSFSPSDPLGAAEQLEAELASDKPYNTIIAPLNTKLSTIGAGLYALRNPEVQVCYAEVAYYHENGYSTPRDEFYVMPIRDWAAAVEGSGS